MYAIVETGGKQYRVSKGDIVEVERIECVPGKMLSLGKVLLYSDGKKAGIGTPYLKNVKVNCEVLGEIKGDKVISFKYKRRKSSRTKIGHRQKYTKLRVKEISVT